MPRASDEAVAHADLRFPYDVERVRAQEVVVLMHGPGERVFDGDRSPGRVSLLDRQKELLETGAGHEPDVGPERLKRRRMAERSGFALNRDCDGCHAP